MTTCCFDQESSSSVAAARSRSSSSSVAASAGGAATMTTATISTSTPIENVVVENFSGLDRDFCDKNNNANDINHHMLSPPPLRLRGKIHALSSSSSSSSSPKCATPVQCPHDFTINYYGDPFTTPLPNRPTSPFTTSLPVVPNDLDNDNTHDLQNEFSSWRYHTPTDTTRHNDGENTRHQFNSPPRFTLRRRQVNFL